MQLSFYWKWTPDILIFIKVHSDPMINEMGRAQQAWLAKRKWDSQEWSCSGPSIIPVLHEKKKKKMATTPLEETIFPTPPPETKLLVQQGSRMFLSMNGPCSLMAWLNSKLLVPLNSSSHPTPTAALEDQPWKGPVSTMVWMESCHSCLRQCSKGLGIF